MSWQDELIAREEKCERYLNLRESWPEREDGEIHRSFGHGDVEHD